MKEQELHNLFESVYELLKALISIPSFSKSEDKTADCIEKFFATYNIPTHRKMNNVWAFNKFYDLVEIVFSFVHVDDERFFRRKRLGPLVVERLELIDVHEVKIVLIRAAAAADVLEDRPDGAVEINILVDLRHERRNSRLYAAH